MKKALTSSGIIFHGRRSSFLSNDVPLHRHFRLPLPYPFSDTTVYAKSGRNCVKGGVALILRTVAVGALISPAAAAAK